MSTPTDGYFDQQGNFIPGSFADQLDLPGPAGSDPAAIAKAQGNLSTEKARGHKNTLNINAANARIKSYEQRLKNKKLTPKQRALLNVEIKRQQGYVTGQSKARQASIKLQTGLQNKVYETSGQYEKLLTGQNRDAYASLRSLFNNFGLGSLAGKIYEYAKQGYGADVISLLLQDTKEYKERFSANEDRVKKGLPVLSPAEYLGAEQSYRQIMQDSGLPKGFYDNPADFRNWIAGDVSPTEVKGRVDLAVANTMQANPDSVKALKQLYGVDQSYITAYFLDQKKALPLLQKQTQAAQYGGEALKRGLTLDKGDLEDFVTAGLSLGQVSSGFQAVAEALPNIQAIAARYGESPFTQHELEKDLVQGVNTRGQGETRRKRLASQERALFSGFGGASPGGLSAGYQAV